MAFWKPGTVAPGVNRPAVSLTSSRSAHAYARSRFRTVALFSFFSRYDERAEDDGALSAVYNPANKLSLPAQRRSLPIFQNRMHILYLVEKYPTVIVVGSTGCGKCHCKQTLSCFCSICINV